MKSFTGKQALSRVDLGPRLGSSPTPGSQENNALPNLLIAFLTTHSFWVSVIPMCTATNLIYMNLRYGGTITSTSTHHLFPFSQTSVWLCPVSTTACSLAPLARSFIEKHRLYLLVFIIHEVCANLPKSATKPEITISYFFFEHTFGARFFSLFVVNIREIHGCAFIEGYNLAQNWSTQNFKKEIKTRKKSFNSFCFKLKNVDSFKSYKGLKLNVKKA